MGILTTIDETIISKLNTTRIELEIFNYLSTIYKMAFPIYLVTYIVVLANLSKMYPEEHNNGLMMAAILLIAPYLFYSIYIWINLSIPSNLSIDKYKQIFFISSSQLIPFTNAIGACIMTVTSSYIFIEIGIVQPTLVIIMMWVSQLFMVISLIILYISIYYVGKYSYTETKNLVQ